MPLYEYECESCGVRFEVIQKYADAPVETCRTCGSHVQRLLSAPAIQFKGTGWYVTDYARKGQGDPSSTAASTDASSTSTSTDKTAAGGSSPSTATTTSSSTSSTGSDKA